MWTLKTKKGFTIVEVLCSITIFSILFMTSLTIVLDSLKLKKYSSKTEQYSMFMEELKNNMIYNTSYKDLQSLNGEGKYYVTEEKIDKGNIKETSIKNMFTNSRPLKEPYLVLRIEEGNVLKVNLKLYIKQFNRLRIMECEFYKGKYKR
ncbi:type II secretion system GspH family protein [Clostridium sp. CX1]|uniref:type II secretion system protein n=1 Tax=Clostridium sp. CX1 TaxID=2978346 RepID=UPI0021BFE4B1|nr:type II secretion system protein [Clostridium sp. CX1]MCT8976047.1 type II secretion system GspH family protein [Clostridium sp. CX1]